MFLSFIGRAGSPAALPVGPSHSLASDSVTATLTEDARVCGRQEALLALTGVCDLLGELLGRACQVRLLARVIVEFFDSDALLLEVQLNVVERLLSVEPDLNAARASANALHVVFIERNVDDILGTRDFLHANDVGALRQAGELQVNDTHFIAATNAVVGLQTRGTSDRVVARQHCLLRSLSLTAWNGI